jgi:HSP20 family molecular chaperone IbpA
MPKDSSRSAVQFRFRGSPRGTLPEGAEAESLWRLQGGGRRWRPPTDVFETDDAYTVVVEIAGMRGADIAVTFEKQVLTIRGQRSEAASQKAYHQMEIAYGEFETQVRMPAPVEVAQVEATYMDGFLRVRLPKARPHRVEVEG